MEEGNSQEKEIRAKLNDLLKEYYKIKESEVKFIPGKTRVQYSGPIFNEEEVGNVLSSLLDGWLAPGNHTRKFESLFADFLGVKYCDTVDSGTGGLLISWLALKNKGLKNPLKDGDEVITSAMNHPSTINCLLHNNLKPVLVDIDMKNYNFDPKLVENAITEKTKGILPMHFLGNPCEMDHIMELVGKHNLAVVEDCCDAYGSKYKGKNVGTFGDLAAHSFYCAHMITTGNGGAITYNREELSPVVKSLRAWGRACVCPECVVAKGNDCSMRYDTANTEFEGYDKRMMFTNIGFNSQIVEMQGAFAIPQMKRLPEFIKKRNENYDFMVNGLRDLEDYFVLPEATPGSEVAWFAVPLTIKSSAPFKRNELVGAMEQQNIETRPFFASNLRKQPAYKDIDLKLVGEDTNTELVKNNSFFIGCYPGLTQEMMQFIIDTMKKFVENH